MRRLHGPGRASRAGFTLLEMMLVGALLVIVSLKAMMVMDGASEAAQTNTTEIVLDGQARQLMTRIGRTIMGAYQETLSPSAEPPFDSTDLTYQVHLGIENGEVIWSDPERIGMQEGSSKVYWAVNPGAENERRVFWTSLVAPYLEGEIPNGMDDNGNGLIDEKGLSFTIDRRAVTIRLTLERQMDGGEVQRKTVETTVTCRNMTPATE